MNRNISGRVKEFVFRRDQGKCVYCGLSENLEFDHVIPITKGGSNTERNIQLVCLKCNRLKFDYIDDDFLRDGTRKPKKKRTRTKNHIPLYIPKVFVDELGWEDGDFISSQSIVYEDDIAFTLIKDRETGNINAFRLEHNGSGEIRLPTALFKCWLYSINDNYNDFNMQLKEHGDQKGLFLIKKDTELSMIYLKENLYKK